MVKLVKYMRLVLIFGFIKNKFLFSDDTFSILLRQKPYAEKGKLELKLPIGRDLEMNI